nr:uncharacterized protein LOC125420776 [Ziziphus jujuba var. spinosa]
MKRSAISIRILEIISSVPPRQSSEEEEEEEEEEDKGGLSHPKEQELEPEVELDKNQRNAEFGRETSPFKRKAYGGSSSSSSRDCLDLLVEAAKLISGNNTEDAEESNKKKKRRKEEDWMVTKGLYGEGSAVVRSKRGRSQTLPSRLRDSVLEPWIRLPRPPLRSTQTTTTRRRRRSS